MLFLFLPKKEMYTYETAKTTNQTSDIFTVFSRTISFHLKSLISLHKVKDKQLIERDKQIIEKDNQIIELNLKLIAILSQLALFDQKISNNKIPKPRADDSFRALWIFLSEHLDDWKKNLVVTPETVIRWQRTLATCHWAEKSRKRGRPPISREIIIMIKQIHKENPLLSPEKIREQLINQNITDVPSANTIRKYLPETKKTPTEKQLQSWKTFLHNHKELWSMDFCTVPTITFKRLYVLVIVSHFRRRIEHIAVTDSPTSEWVIQQIREATPFGKQPKYLLHDRGSAFTSGKFQQFLKGARICSIKTSPRSPWQNAICERTIGILRQELLNHLIPLNQEHIQKHLTEYVEKYYNTHRTHQGIECQTPDITSQKQHP